MTTFFFQNLCPKLDITDYGGGGGSPESPEIHHCSSTTQALGNTEVISIYFLIKKNV